MCLTVGSLGAMDAPEFDIKLVAEQAKGAQYVAAGGARLPHLGERGTGVKAGGRVRKTKRRGTKVRKPLLSVCRACDAGNRVTFYIGQKDWLSDRMLSGRGVRMSRRRGIARKEEYAVSVMSASARREQGHAEQESKLHNASREPGSPSTEELAKHLPAHIPLRS